MKSLLILLAVCVAALAGPPIIIGDGTVCLRDDVMEFPNDANNPQFQHERTFKAAKVVVEPATGAGAACGAAACTTGNCNSFKDMFIEYRDGKQIRQLIVASDGNNLRVTSIGVPFHDWPPALTGGPHNHIRKGGGKILRVFVDGVASKCHDKQPCRLSIHEETPAQAAQ